MQAWTGDEPADGAVIGAAVQPACSQGVLERYCHVVLDLSSLPAGDMNVVPRDGSFTLPKVPGAAQRTPSSGRPQPGPQLPPQAATSASAWAWPSMLPAFASGPGAGAGQPCSACHLSPIEVKPGVLMLASTLPVLAPELAQVEPVLPQRHEDTVFRLPCTLRSTTSRLGPCAAVHGTRRPTPTPACLALQVLAGSSPRTAAQAGHGRPRRPAHRCLAGWQEHGRPTGQRRHGRHCASCFRLVRMPCPGSCLLVGASYMAPTCQTGMQPACGTA